MYYTPHRISVEPALFFVSGEENKKMAPISLKDPNIQALAEELVKELTSFKVIGIFFTTVYNDISESKSVSFFPEIFKKFYSLCPVRLI